MEEGTPTEHHPRRTSHSKVSHPGARHRHRVGLAHKRTAMFAAIGATMLVITGLYAAAFANIFSAERFSSVKDEGGGLFQQLEASSGRMNAYVEDLERAQEALTKTLQIEREKQEAIAIVKDRIRSASGTETTGERSANSERE